MSCTGDCCAVIQLPFSLEDWRKHAGHMLDGDQIAGMVQPLTAVEATERYARLTGRYREYRPDGHYFKCRNWDESTRLCRVYESRPMMCRDYPYGEPCDHCGCSDGLSLVKRAQQLKATPTKEK